MRFTTLLAGKAHTVSYVVQHDEIQITHVSGDGVKAIGAHRAIVMRRLRQEANEHLLKHNTKMAEAYTLWYNGVDFKEYFKLRADEGGSLVFEIGDYWEYCQGAREAAEH